MAKYKMRIVLTEVYSVWVDAVDEEDAKLAAFHKFNGADDAVEQVSDSMDCIIDEIDE